jgi:hypothetical protein
VNDIDDDYMPPPGEIETLAGMDELWSLIDKIDPNGTSPVLTGNKMMSAAREARRVQKGAPMRHAEHRALSRARWVDTAVVSAAELAPNAERVVTDYWAACDAGEPTGRAAFHVFLAAWFRCGLPRIVIGQRHAAALMCTHARADALAEVRPPWDAFVLDVPPDLVTVDAFNDQDERNKVPIAHLAILADLNGRVWVWPAPSSDGSLFAGCVTARDFRALAEPWDGDGPRSLLARLALGVTLEMTVHRQAHAHARGPRVVRRSMRGEPVTTQFQVVRDVKVDVRRAVRDYCRGVTRSAPTVQHLVRGHWKRQICGAALADRKLIFVEPYWRGPEDAPIALRNHVLGSGAQT